MVERYIKNGWKTFHSQCCPWWVSLSLQYYFLVRQLPGLSSTRGAQSLPSPVTLSPQQWPCFWTCSSLPCSGTVTASATFLMLGTSTREKLIPSLHSSRPGRIHQAVCCPISGVIPTTHTQSLYTNSNTPLFLSLHFKGRQLPLCRPIGVRYLNWSFLFYRSNCIPGIFTILIQGENQKILQFLTW